MKEFKYSRADVIMIQETHFHHGRGLLNLLANTSPLQIHPQAGVAILIKCTCPLRVKSSCLDPHGRFISLNCDYLNHSLTLVNVYAPNFGQVQFFTDMFERLEKFSQPFMILGTDFNMTVAWQG